MFRSFKTFALASVMAAALCAPQAMAQNTFKMAFQGNLNTLDPYTINETFTLAMQGNVYEGLTARNEKLEIIPGLAEKWELLAPNKWRFHLRKGVKFHGGEPFTADDVLFSAERVRKPDSDLKARVPKDAVFTKVDDHTVDVTMPGPNPILHYSWDTWYIMSKAWAEKNGAVEPIKSSATTPGYSTLNANGTGAFKVSAHQTGVKTELVKNPDWWNDKAKKHNLDKVIFTPISNDATRVAALLSGEVDWVDPVPVQDQERVNSNATTKMMAGGETRTIYLGFDQRRDKLNAPAQVPGDKNPFKDARVRKAVYQAIDENLIAQRVMRGQAVPSALMLDPSLFPSYAKEFKRHPYDTAAAEKLLDEAGFPRVGGAQGNRFTVGMDCPNDRYVNDAAICQAVIAMLSRVGVKVEPIIQPRAQYFAKILAPGGFNTNFYLLGWTVGTNDPHNVLEQLHQCRDDKGSGGIGVANVGGYCNAKVDELSKKILVENDVAKRDLMIKEAFQIIHEEVGHVPLHQQALAWGMSKKVSIDQRADNMIMLYTVKMQ